jgi:hypothetical protein
MAVAVVRFALADGRREVARPIADAAIGLDNVKKLRELQDTETMREAEYNIYRERERERERNVQSWVRIWFGAKDLTEAKRERM